MRVCYCVSGFGGLSLRAFFNVCSLWVSFSWIWGRQIDKLVLTVNVFIKYGGVCLENFSIKLKGCVSVLVVVEAVCLLFNRIGGALVPWIYAFILQFLHLLCQFVLAFLSLFCHFFNSCPVNVTVCLLCHFLFSQLLGKRTKEESLCKGFPKWIRKEQLSRLNIISWNGK